MPDAPLMRPLFDGPLDLVGDVHGEIETLRSLLGHLGYAGYAGLDYSVGKRHRERLDGVLPGSYRTRLAALRWPERVLTFDDGEAVPVR
jgi:hypothetical protein